MKEALFCSLTVDMSDDEIKECIHRMHPKVIEQNRGFVLTISGFDHDPRELWQIPEAVQFLKRLVEMGFMSVLAVSGQEDMPGSPAFGALECWYIATDRISEKKKYEVTPTDWKQFHDMLMESNDKCYKILQEPCPDAGITELRQDLRPSLKEGQHRHGSR